MDRRRFLLTSLAGALTAPLAAEAQRVGRVARVGVLSPFSSSFGAGPSFDAFRETLRQLG